MKAVIPEGLISMYDLTVPYALDFLNIRKKLDGELEKLHPCFPERYTADYHVRFHPYRKGGPGIHIRAVVIDRLQLAEFRKKNAHALLYAGGACQYPIFSGEILRKRLCLAAAVLVALIVLFSAVCISQTKTASAFDDAAAEPAITGPSAVSGTGISASDAVIDECSSADSDDYTPVLPDFSPFLECIYKQGGSISSLSWNAGKYELSFQISGLYPEQLSDAVTAGFGGDTATGLARYGPVAYRDDVPEMQLTLQTETATQQKAVMAAGPQEKTQMLSKAASALSAVRELIKKQGGSLVSETVSPPSLSGSVPESGWGNFAAEFQLLQNVCAGEGGGFGISQLELVRSGSDVMLSLSLSDEVSQPYCLLPFSNLTCVFFDAPGLPYASSSETEWESALSQQREIGRIVREDGSAVVFFHNSEGKIERRIYE